MIYLDNAATTLIKPASVQKAMFRAMNIAASPGRGGHVPAMRAADIVYRCRESAARLFNVSEPERVVFTMNATHALNIAINSLALRGSKVLISGYEHNSVVRPLEALGAKIIIAEAPLFDKAAALKAFKEKINGAQLVVCTHVSNVFGFILPIYEIAELCRVHKVPLIVDASQSAGVLDVDYERLGAAFVAMPGHKALFGPQGTGILLCGQTGTPLLSGGSGSDSISPMMPDFLPDRHEAGTHNVPGIAGLMAGINYVLDRGTENIRRYEHTLLEASAEQLSKIKGITVFHGGPGAQSGALSIVSQDHGSEELAQRLGAEGVCVRAGLHCAPCAHRSAGTLESGTVRLSFSPFLRLEDIRNFSAILQKLLNTKS